MLNSLLGGILPYFLQASCLNHYRHKGSAKICQKIFTDTTTSDGAKKTMWNWFKKSSNKRSEHSNKVLEDKNFLEVGKLFHELESDFVQCGDGYDKTKIVCLTSIIDQADKVLELIRQYQLGNMGIIRSQTLLYQALSLSRRADCYFQEGYVHDRDLKANCMLAIKDYNRAEQLSIEWNVPVTIMTNWCCLCYLELEMFDRAIAAAELMCAANKSYDNFRLLSSCYLKLGKYGKAEELATEAIRYSNNDYVRRQAYSWRSTIYREMGNEGLAEQDFQKSESYK